MDEQLSLLFPLLLPIPAQNCELSGKLEQRQAMASLVARGKELLRDGDFSSARLILQRAADAGGADAVWGANTCPCSKLWKH